MASLFATRAAVPRHVGRVQRRSTGTAVRASAENEQPAVIEQPKKKVSGPKAERFKVADGQLGNVSAPPYSRTFAVRGGWSASVRRAAATRACCRHNSASRRFGRCGAGPYGDLTHTDRCTAGSAVID